ncbi:YfdX family protein [Sulfurovum sp. NBC37-1]|uniref:YfdX family protein n=1 Tax=Sulfurovum sp. (strain NBC37-1) TaxID=387093 RepID=UPI0001587BEB|nr:YfdX family protein [Sulfurovum sp. NBC37-1]BAF72236.1 conserved hypothetical protein [Sulfurovum sp. NBC37-1]
MKKRFLLSALTCGLLLGATGLQAKTDKKELVNNVMQQEVKNHKQAPKEIVAGMQNTFAALQAMQAGKKEDAKKALESATKSFDAALKADPSLDIIPIDERFQAFAFMGTSDVIDARLKLAQQLLKAHDTQAATAVLTPLKDELDISVISIPMKIYPVATKKALDELNKGNDKAAFAAIAEAMNSLVVVKAIIPTPLLTAQDLITDASKLDKSKKDEAQKLLAAAKEELKRAELLGYVSRHEAAYKLLNDDIEKIQKEIKGKNMVEKLYDTLKNDFKKIIANTKISKETPEQAAEQKVNVFEKKEAQKAVKVKEEFKQEAQKDEKKTVQ